MSIDEWESHLEAQINAAIAAMASCDDEEKQLVMLALENNVKALCYMLRNGTVLIGTGVKPEGRIPTAV
jgi:hypothetical protein